MTRLPCLRYKLTEANLYRTAFHHFEFFRLHVMVGPTYGDFHVRRVWTMAETKTLDLVQGGDAILRITIREFVPTDEEMASTDARGNKMYRVPWAVADPDEATTSVNSFIDQNGANYLNHFVVGADPLVRDVFRSAVKLASLPEPVIPNSK